MLRHRGVTGRTLKLPSSQIANPRPTGHKSWRRIFLLFYPLRHLPPTSCDFSDQRKLRHVALTVTGATTSMAVAASPVTYPGDAFDWKAHVSGAVDTAKASSSRQFEIDGATHSVAC